MPSLYIRKPYIKKSMYHVIHRGINKRELFKDPQDFEVFTQYLIEYLQPKELTSRQIRESHKSHEIVSKKLFYLDKLKNYHDKIELISYALMPNHIHLQIYQASDEDMSKFLHSICIRYSSYFHKKYRWLGTIYQSRFKAKLVDTDEYCVWVSKYIHLNPSVIAKPNEYKWSSYRNYATQEFPHWIKPSKLYKSYRKSPYAKGWKSYGEYLEDWSV